MGKEAHKRATRIRASRLLGAVKDVIGVVAAKQTIPILAHVLIEAGNGSIRLTATDMDMEARRECVTDDRDGTESADWRASILPFALTVPAKALVGILGEIDGDAMVTLTASDDVAATSPGRLTIAAGRSRFRLNTLPSADFPILAVIDAAHEFDIAAGVLADAIDSVGYAVSIEETRYYLNGIYIHPVAFDLRLAATDGHRLARLCLDAPDGAFDWPAMIVPRAAFAQLARVLAQTMKAAANPQVTVRTNSAGTVMSFGMPAADEGEIVLITKAIDGIFPDYTRVIPSIPPHELTVARESLAEAVRRVAVLAHKESRLIRLDIGNDQIELTTTNVDLGDACEQVRATYDGLPYTIGFDSRYLRDVLGKIPTDDIVIRWTDGNAPVRLEASGAAAPDPGELPRVVHVLMPVRV